MTTLSCIGQCFIADEMLEQLPVPVQVGKTKVGGIDFNKARMRWVIQAVLALSATPNGFRASHLAEQVRKLSRQSETEYDPRRAAYDLKKLRGKQIVQRIGQTARHQPLPRGLRAMAALVVLRDKAIKPLLAAAQPLRPTRHPQNPTQLDAHYTALRTTMQNVFYELGVAA